MSPDHQIGIILLVLAIGLNAFVKCAHYGEEKQPKCEPIELCEELADKCLKEERECRQILVSCREDMTSLSAEYGLACESSLCIDHE